MTNPMTNEYIEGKLTQWRGNTISDHEHFIKELRVTLTDTWNKAREEAYAELRGKVAKQSDV